MIRDECMLNTINNILYIKKGENEDKNGKEVEHDKKVDHPFIKDIYIQHKDVLSQVVLIFLDLDQIRTYLKS